MPAPITARASRGALVALFAVAVASCGTTSSQGDAVKQSAPHAKRGGILRVLAQADVDSVDPGVTYSAYGMVLSFATQRPLMHFRPGQEERAVADLAESVPVVSPDGRRVTVRIRRDVEFSPPVSRAVTSADVKYAIE